MGLLDSVFGGDSNNNNNSNKKNPLANWGSKFGAAAAAGRRRTFHGQGQSLGGSKPGKVISIVLSQAGPLGMRVERRPNSQGTAIVNDIVDGSQAQAAGVLRGDILCFAGSDGQEEIMYDMFMDLAKSDTRPIHLEVRRLDPTAKQQHMGGGSMNGKKSAETDHRKQAMIAAAEARDKQHKEKNKPVKHVTKSTQTRLLQNNSNRNTTAGQQTPQTEASRQAAAAAKQGEAVLAAQLGYNPYETAKSTAGQARTGVTATQHGSIAASSGDGTTTAPLPTVSPPIMPTTSVEDDIVELPSEFQEAYATAISTNNDGSHSVTSSFGIIHKLVTNATTKGQAADDDNSAKFRKIRLGNAKIKAALVDLPGGVELMLAFGFSLEEMDGESVLLYPPSYVGPTWLPSALRQLESYQGS